MVFPRKNRKYTEGWRDGVKNDYKADLQARNLEY